MGVLNAWPLDGLVRDLARAFDIRHFVETGTFEGDGCSWAAGIFPSVTTIEKRQDYRDAAAARYAHLPIDFRVGDSAEVMPQVVDGLSGPSLFWLDGHAGAGLFGPEDDCPLLAELKAIASSPLDHFIIIDDARAFLAPPPPPFIAETWPNICDVLDLARAGPPKLCIVIADAIICVPPFARDVIAAFCSQIRPVI